MDDATFRALLDRTLAERVETAPQPRGMNPWRPAPQRPERRTRVTYRDPTASEAVGNIDRERKQKQ